MKYIVKHGAEYYHVDADGMIARPKIGMAASGQWRITGAVERNNFGHVIAIITFADLKACGELLNWQYKNGKQRIFMRDFDHGTMREWRSSGHAWLGKAT